MDINWVPAGQQQSTALEHALEVTPLECSGIFAETVAELSVSCWRGQNEYLEKSRNIEKENIDSHPVFWAVEIRERPRRQRVRRLRPLRLMWLSSDLLFFLEIFFFTNLPSCNVPDGKTCENTARIWGRYCLMRGCWSLKSSMMHEYTGWFSSKSSFRGRHCNNPGKTWNKIW